MYVTVYWQIQKRGTYSFQEGKSAFVVVEDDTDVRVFTNHIGLTEELKQLWGADGT